MKCLLCEKALGPEAFAGISPNTGHAIYLCQDTKECIARMKASNK